MTDEPIKPTHRIAEAGKATRFGQPGGPDPVEAAKKNKGNQHSIRNNLRRIAGADVDITRALTHQDIVRMFGREGTKISMAQAVAIGKFKKAMNGDVKAMQQLEDSIDGKLADKRVEAQVTLADLVNGSYEHEESERDQESE